MEQQLFELNAEVRKDMGKGASRRLRRTGNVPAILYGAGKEPTVLMVNQNELNNHLKHEAFYSHVLVIKIAGQGEEKAVLKDLQRHPFEQRILHLDLQRVSDSEKLHMNVPIHFLNEENCVGVKVGGGIISHHLAEVEIYCLPKDLPEFLAVDLTDVNAGDVLHLSDIKCPAGVEIVQLSHGEEHNLPVVSVHLPRGATEETAEG